MEVAAFEGAGTAAPARVVEHLSFHLRYGKLGLSARDPLGIRRRRRGVVVCLEFVNESVEIRILRAVESVYMAIKKELLINALQSIEIDDREHVPTAVLFSKDGVFIGTQAFDRALDGTDINENFKLNLGEVAQSRLDPPMFETGDGKPRSAHQISAAYIEGLIKGANAWVSERGLRQAKRILVSEPLALDRISEGSLDCLANYRYRIRAILGS